MELFFKLFLHFYIGVDKDEKDISFVFVFALRLGST